MASTPQCTKRCDSTWIFGYGSLAHTPNFDFDQRVVGYIKGWRRVFWQGSTDHRGTPQRPGRTVTLTPDNKPDAATWGVAFQLAGSPEEQAATLSYLEWREKQYDVRERVDVYGAGGEVLVQGALVYIASPANANYLGPAELTHIAVQISTCRGPSGPNCEYLFKLADAMRGFGVPDPDLFHLEDLVRQQLEAQRLVQRAPLDAAAGGAAGTLAAAAVEAVGGIPEGLEEEEVLDDHDFRRWHQRGRFGQLSNQLRPQAGRQEDAQPPLLPLQPPQQREGLQVDAPGLDAQQVPGKVEEAHGRVQESGLQESGLQEECGRTDAERCGAQHGAPSHLVFAVEAVCRPRGTPSSGPG